MNKEEIYNKIDQFKKDLLPKLNQTSIKNLEKYVFYVNDTDAIDVAEFIGELIKNKIILNSYPSILDMTFGSGNLTAHIVLENNIAYQNIYFNDIFEESNSNIVDVIENASLSSLNILDAESFMDFNVDLLIVNPQISGRYKGDLSKQNENYEEKLKTNLMSFYDKNTTIIFYDSNNHFSNLFESVKYIRYLREKGDLYVINKGFKKNICYEKIDDKFEINKECKKTNKIEQDDISFDELIDKLNNLRIDEGITGLLYTNKKSCIFSDESKGNLDFIYKNILFKGVPGTGKSRAINEIIKNYLGLAKNDKNTLRINIHSASSNSDLMQGIGISSENGNIKYSEKQGLILDIIKRATFHPNQPFVLILEEIQENSLNELIGDLIYLIEDDKRAKLIADNQDYDSYEDLVDKLIDQDDTLDYVEIPYLVNDSTKYKKMIMPNNLFIFCTSNYRDDKKVIEDNLLRRFEVIEIYPKKTVVNDYAKDFFDNLNKSINTVMEKQGEIHPDRFLIGHAIWKDVENKELFYKAFSKLVTEFKDIREIEFDVFKSIIKDISLPNDVSIKIENSYYEMIKDIQSKIGYEFIS